MQWGWMSYDALRMVFAAAMHTLTEEEAKTPPTAPPTLQSEGAVLTEELQSSPTRAPVAVEATSLVSTCNGMQTDYGG